MVINESDIVHSSAHLYWVNFSQHSLPRVVNDEEALTRPDRHPRTLSQEIVGYKNVARWSIEPPSELIC